MRNGQFLKSKKMKNEHILFHHPMDDEVTVDGFINGDNEYSWSIVTFDYTQKSLIGVLQASELKKYRFLTVEEYTQLKKVATIPT